jgi:hypothetical protein
MIAIDLENLSHRLLLEVSCSTQLLILLISLSLSLSL